MQNRVVPSGGECDDSAPGRCAALARLSEPIVTARLLVIVAHPDDETIGAGALLARSLDAHVIVTTNGAPSNRSEWPPDVSVSTPEGYAALRREELRGALAAAGVDWDRVHQLDVTDGEASLHIAQIARRLVDLIARINPEIVLTHAYEGGHLDHDATALAVHAALAMSDRGHAHEMALYHGVDGGIAVHQFLPGQTPSHTARLDEKLRERKSTMLASYVSQRHYDSYFGVDAERYRCAPAYDFRRSPDPGSTLLYERHHSQAAETWRSHAHRALRELNLTDRFAGPRRDRVDDASCPPAPAGPLVSVIVRTIGRQTLRDTLRSIASQTYRNTEVVLVDARADAADALCDVPEGVQLRICAAAGFDRPSAANVGLDEARGDYVTFLDDDDWFHPEHLASLVTTLRTSDCSRVAYAGVEVLEWLDEGGPRRRGMFDSPFDPIALLCENYIPLNALLIDRQVLGDHRFDEQFPVFEDWDFLIGLSRRTSFTKVPQVGAVYRWPQGSGVSDPAAIGSVQKRVYAKWRSSLSADEYRAIMERGIAENELRTNRQRSLEVLLSHLNAQDRELDALREVVRSQDIQLEEFRRVLERPPEPEPPTEPAPRRFWSFRLPDWRRQESR